MIEISEELFKKHEVGIMAARNYYVLNQPTGLSDSYYNSLEELARLDGIELRDFVCQEIQGKRSQNASYIGKVEKSQVTGDMSSAVKYYVSNHPEIKYLIPKYDGSSLAAYYDISTGKCMRVVTIGGSNLGSEGIDQTEKFAKYFPDLPGTGICALQSECLVSLEHGFGDKSRQKANGLVNALYEPMDYQTFLSNSSEVRSKKDYEKYIKKFRLNLDIVKKEVDDYIGIRCFRYFIAPGYPSLSYKEVINNLPRVYNSSGDCKFSGGYILEPGDISEIHNKDIWETPTGTFLVDGIVGYTDSGECVRALKYKDAGRGESTEVLKIQWNNQISKGKDSWSANAIVNPIKVRGSEIKKPSVGSVKKMVERGLSKGAKVTVILANSTIPQVSEVLEAGNLDYEWPVCSCGYRMSEKDIYGTLLKCGNLDCSERFNRMVNYLKTCKSWNDIDFNKLTVIDRFDWSKKSDLTKLVSDIRYIISNNLGINELYKYMSGYMSTDLQKRNLTLIITPLYKALMGYVG